MILYPYNLNMIVKVVGIQHIYMVCARRSLRIANLIIEYNLFIGKFEVFENKCVAGPGNAPGL
jgi:hypothetical protein